MSSLLSISACASIGISGTEKLTTIAVNSSCDNPVIFKHLLKGEDLQEGGKASLFANDIPQAERTARVHMMGFKGAAPLPSSDCTDTAITKYQLASSDETPTNYLYAKHMTKAEIKVDLQEARREQGDRQGNKNVKCKSTYSQVYQPPLKLGGSGRVIQVPSGERCVTKKANGGSSVQPIEIAPNQMIVALLTDIECSSQVPLLVWLPDPQLKGMRKSCKKEYLYDTVSRRDNVFLIEEHANLGTISAKYHLANFYLFGIEKPQSTQTALGIFQKLADRKFVDAHVMLSKIYKSKEYGVFDLEKSKYHFQQAGLLIHLKWADIEREALDY